MNYEPPDHMPDPKKPSDWALWTHKRDPALTLRVPRDVVLVRINGRSPHLSREGCSPLVPIKDLPVIGPGEVASRDYPAAKLLRLYSPPNS